jgi:hypothetical protein
LTKKGGEKIEVSAILSGVALAQENSINLGPPSGWGNLSFTLGGLIPALITLVLIIAALVAFAFLVFGGIKWITAGGDKANTESARNTITAALIGLAIVFSAWAILSLIQNFFGVNITSLTLPTVNTTTP